MPEDPGMAGGSQPSPEPCSVCAHHHLRFSEVFAIFQTDHSFIQILLYQRGKMGMGTLVSLKAPVASEESKGCGQGGALGYSLPRVVCAG